MLDICIMHFQSSDPNLLPRHTTSRRFKLENDFWLHIAVRRFLGASEYLTGAMDICF